MRLFQSFSFLLLLSICLACSENGGNPVNPDDNIVRPPVKVFDINDSSLIPVNEYFKGNIMGNDFDWTNMIDRRQAVHGYQETSNDSGKFSFYSFGFNTWPIYHNDYFLDIYHPSTKISNTDSLIKLLSPGNFDISKKNSAYFRQWRIHLWVIDSVESSGKILTAAVFNSCSNCEDSSYIKIISSVFYEKADYYVIKVKMEISARLYPNGKTDPLGDVKGEMVKEIWIMKK